MLLSLLSLSQQMSLCTQSPWGSQQCLSNYTRETFCGACSRLLQPMALHSGVRRITALYVHTAIAKHKPHLAFPWRL